jgi:hypothetical protein
MARFALGAKWGSSGRPPVADGAAAEAAWGNNSDASAAEPRP